MNYRSAAALREAPRIQQLCFDAASMLYTQANQPSLTYQHRVARLLFMTLAHEGRFVYRRQLARGGGFMSADGDTGAFGLAQCEKGSILDSVRFARARPPLEQRVARFLAPWSHWGEWPRMRAHLQVPDGDRLSVALCRLHYLRAPSLVPGSIADMARYAKLHYNTVLGAATPENYREAYEQLWPGD